MLEDQKSKLLQISKSYTDSINSSDRRSWNEIRAFHLKQLQSVLLPEQLSAVSKKIYGNRFLSRILSARVANKISLSKEQKRAITEKCSTLNSSIKELLQEVEERKSKIRQQIHEIYTEELTDQQKRQIERGINVEDRLEKMSILDFEADTSF